MGGAELGGSVKEEVELQIGPAEYLKEDCILTKAKTPRSLLFEGNHPSTSQNKFLKPSNLC